MRGDIFIWYLVFWVSHCMLNVYIIFRTKGLMCSCIFLACLALMIIWAIICILVVGNMVFFIVVCMFLSLLAAMGVTISNHSRTCYAEISNAPWCCNRPSLGWDVLQAVPHSPTHSSVVNGWDCHHWVWYARGYRNSHSYFHALQQDVSPRFFAEVESTKNI